MRSFVREYSAYKGKKGKTITGEGVEDDAISEGALITTYTIMS